MSTATAAFIGGMVGVAISAAVNGAFLKNHVKIDHASQVYRVATTPDPDVLFCYARFVGKTKDTMFLDIELRGVKPSDIKQILMPDYPTRKIALKDKNKKGIPVTVVSWGMYVSELPKNRSKENALKIQVTIDESVYTVRVRASTQTEVVDINTSTIGAFVARAFYKLK